MLIMTCLGVRFLVCAEEARENNDLGFLERLKHEEVRWEIPPETTLCSNQRLHEATKRGSADDLRAELTSLERSGADLEAICAHNDPCRFTQCDD